jgi:hypothetical protein
MRIARLTTQTVTMMLCLFGMMPITAAKAAWTVLPSPTGLGDSRLVGVSCGSQSSCIAVGSADGGALAERWDGTAWTVTPLPTPAEATGSILRAVSCTGPTFCTAVGAYTNANPGLTVLIEMWDGTSWAIVGTPSSGDNGLAAVSCSSATACLAVGGGVSGGLAEVWNGVAWMLTPAPPVAWSVSCVSASDCTAVGWGTATRWDGADWVALPTPATPPILPSQPLLLGISCTSASDCVAVGANGFGGTSGFRMISSTTERWNGSTWTADALPSAPYWVALAAVSCSSPNACLAVGVGASTLRIAWWSLLWPFAGGGGAPALRWDGVAWTSQEPTTGTLPELDAITCLAPGSCIAVGSLDSNAVVEGYAFAPPGPLAPPSISGLAHQGQPLSEIQGSWSNGPTSFTYQWERCDTAGRNCSNIPQATNQTYVLTGADVGATIAASETATNNDGTGPPATSAPTPTVTPLATPVNQTAPMISGRAGVWYRLAASAGTWTGAQPLSYDFQWQRCRARCVPIANATTRVHILTRADRRARIRVVVTATNGDGSAATSSAQTAPVAAPASRRTITARLQQTLTPRGRAATIGRLLRVGRYRLTLIAPTAGRAAITWDYRPAPAGRRHRGRHLFAAGTARFAHAGRVTLTLVLTHAGKSLLKHAHRLTLTSHGIYEPTGQKLVSVTKPFMLAR